MFCFLGKALGERCGNVYVEYFNSLIEDAATPTWYGVKIGERAPGPKGGRGQE